MTAATEARDSYRKDPDVVAQGVNASETILQGTLVVIDSDGYLQDGEDAANMIFGGVAYESETGGAADGDESARVYTTGSHEMVYGGGDATVALIGQVVYLVDNQTVDEDPSQTTYAIACGVIQEVVSETKVMVRIDGFAHRTRQEIKQVMSVDLDLSGSAQAEVPLLHALRAHTIIAATLLYTEASSADAGVAVKIGKEGDDDYYYTGTSEVSKSAWYEKAVTLLATDLAAGDTLTVSNAGGKTGAGVIRVCIEYV